MKRIFLFLAMTLCITTLTFAQGKEILIDDFEITISGGPDGTVDFGAGNGSAVNVTAATDIKNSGKQSLKVEFDAMPGGYMYIARGYGLDAKNSGWLVKTEDIDWKNVKAIAFSMYGSDSKAQVVVDIKDSGNEMWRFTFDDNFTGWHQIVCPIESFQVRDDWQPDSADKNANLDLPIKSLQFEILPPAKGTLYFDTVLLIEK